MTSIHEATADMVEHPSHYTNGSVECIDAIESALTPIQFRGYLRGNVLKYIWRMGLKGGHKKAVEDAKKAQWYLSRLIKELEDEGSMEGHRGL